MHKKIEDEQLKKILSSVHFNFLFGSGINGSQIPQMDKFSKTNDFILDKLDRAVISLESDIALLNEVDIESVTKIFHDELKYFINNINPEAEEFKDISSMFSEVNKIILSTQNRNISMKQVNIYTLNYDHIVETEISKLGYLVNTVTLNDINKNDKFFDVLGYNYKKNNYIPTYLVSKIHGDINNPILPTKKKYNDVLLGQRFEILFNMKTQISRPNSVLIVMGYSGNDSHINSIINDAIISGLTVLWFKYDNDSFIPKDLNRDIWIVEQEDNANKINPTKRLKKILESSWD